MNLAAEHGDGRARHPPRWRARGRGRYHRPVSRLLAAVLLALPLAALAQQGGPLEGGPVFEQPLAQRRPPDTARTPAVLRLARQEPVPCGPRATAAVVALATMGRIGKLTLEEFGALRAFGASDEAARHPVLVAMALAVGMEHELPLDEVTPAQREALLDVLLSPAIPRPECLKPSVVQGVRFRVIAEACTDLENRRVDVKAFAQAPSRVYLLMAHRTGEDITGDCRALLRKELGAPEEPEDPPGQPAAPPATP